MVNEIQNVPIVYSIVSNNLLMSCISDDTFIDKQTLFELISGKGFYKYDIKMIDLNQKRGFIITIRDNNKIYIRK